MGKAQSKPEDCRREEFAKARKIIQREGVTGAQRIIREKLEELKNVEIKFGVTGTAGVGKSSFINSIRGIEDDDELAAKVGQVETTSKPASYTYPDNPNIKFMDLPGVGSPNFPDFTAYCKEVKLETYDIFLILTATRFTNLDLQLAQKINSMKKSCFLIRTKIDVDEHSEKRKKNQCDVKDMEKTIRADCYKNVKDYGIDEDKIFLICTYETKKWDFERLVQAILEPLSSHQKEALTLSLSVNHLSAYVVEEKVKVMRDELHLIFTFASYIPLELLLVTPAEAVFMAFKLSARILIGLDAPRIGPPEETEASGNSNEELLVAAVFQKKAQFYRSQLGLPEKDSDEFQKMKPKFQERMKTFYQREDANHFAEYLRRINLPNALSSESPYQLAENFLNKLLDDMQQLSLDILQDAATQVKEEINPTD